jgi:hypothetical protein
VRGILFKNPSLLLQRFLNKVASGKGQEAVLGYADMWRRNFDLKELLTEVLTEDEMDSHTIMTRIMFNLRKEGLKPPHSFDRYTMLEMTDIPELTQRDFDNLAEIQSFAYSMNGMVENVGAVAVDYVDPGWLAYTASL